MAASFRKLESDRFLSAFDGNSFLEVQPYGRTRLTSNWCDLLVPCRCLSPVPPAAQFKGEKVPAGRPLPERTEESSFNPKVAVSVTPDPVDFTAVETAQE
jgi:hypothetical protein